MMRQYASAVVSVSREPVVKRSGVSAYAFWVSNIMRAMTLASES